MHPVLRNVLSVIAGLAAGSIVNMSLVTLGGKWIDPPAGADLTSMEGLTASMHLMEPRHFLFPFLAHALGTLAGAAAAAWLATGKKMRMALVVGAFFFVGGALNIWLLPSPMWFAAVDLVLAYFPMAYLAGRLVAPQSPAA